MKKNIEYQTWVNTMLKIDIGSVKRKLTYCCLMNKNYLCSAKEI